MEKIFKMLALWIIVPICSFAQTEDALIKNLSKNYLRVGTIQFGQFYFDSLEVPVRYTDTLFEKELPGIQFYTCNLLSMGCWAFEYYKCIVAYNPSTDLCKIFPPLWYSGIEESFCSLFLTPKLKTKERFAAYIFSICKLLVSTSDNMEFENLVSTGSSMKYDLTRRFLVNSEKRIWHKLEFNLTKEFQIEKIAF